MKSKILQPVNIHFNYGGYINEGMYDWGGTGLLGSQGAAELISRGHKLKAIAPPPLHEDNELREYPKEVSELDVK